MMMILVKSKVLDPMKKKTKIKQKKMICQILKNADLPYELPPESDDPITNKNRQLFYTKLRRIPKDEISKPMYAYARLTESGKLLHKNVKEETIFYKIAAELEFPKMMMMHSSIFKWLHLKVISMHNDSNR